MMLTATHTNFLSISLIEQINVITILLVTVIFFLILLILGIMKSFKLKAENERLSESKRMSTEEKNKVYRDFREGHLYDNY
ncbi:MAG: hypothetical protein HKN54_08610 [Flavobacteriaceae bacterium]|nr:hypothetical protein [Flavobacteriaceae bacterium]